MALKVSNKNRKKKVKFKADESSYKYLEYKQ
jgi:hypothetical protein